MPVDVLPFKALLSVILHPVLLHHCAHIARLALHGTLTCLCLGMHQAGSMACLLFMPVSRCMGLHEVAIVA